MSRPRRSHHIREALIQTGITQISTHGYHGTGIKQILDEVKVPKGSFYNFFASKEALVAEVIKAYSDEMHQQLHAFIQGKGSELSIGKQLLAIHKFALEKVVNSDFQQSCLIGSLSTEVTVNSTACTTQLTLATQRWMTFLTERIIVGQQQREFRDDLHAEQLANLYWATWQGTFIKLHMNKDCNAALMDIKSMLLLFNAQS